MQDHAFGGKRIQETGEGVSKNTQLFSGKAEVYAKYRPSYSPAFIDYLFMEAGFGKDAVIADIGSGTGKLSKQLLDRGSKVICVEPNDDMRRCAERDLSIYPNYISVKGTAENSTLPGRSVDYIITAQAFHWFDAGMFKIECQRILKTEGKVILVWNSKDENNQLVKENADIYRRLCPNFKGFSGGSEEDPESFSAFFRHGCEFRTFENKLTYTLEEFIGGCLSASYAPKEGDKNYRQFVDELTELFNKYCINGVLEVPNITRSYVGEV